MATVDLNLLPTFVAVAKAASFSGAARQLRVPKSSVSRAIAALEETMGVRLVHRTTRHVALSTAGAALFDRVAPLLDALSDSVVELPEREEEPSGLLRITASVDLGATVLAELIAKFVQRYPAIQIDLRLTSSVLDLVQDGIDVALRASNKPLADSALYAKRLGAVELQLFGSPEYLARRGTPRTTDDLETHDFVRFAAIETFSLEGPRGVVRIKPKGSITCDDMWFARAAVCAGVGLALLPTFLADAEIEQGRLVAVLPKLAMRSSVLWFVCPVARHLPKKVAVFRDFLLEALAKKPLAPRH
jgi:DNA-binding transcriptional LysR family regulator